MTPITYSVSKLVPDLVTRWFKTKKDRRKAMESLYDVKLAKTLILARTAKNWRQGRLAKKLGVTQGYISQIENAVVLPSHKQLKRIAAALDCDLHAPMLTNSTHLTQQEGKE